MTAFLGIRGLMGNPASLGVDETLKVYSEDADWFDIVAWNNYYRAFEELAEYNGKIVILIHSMGWHGAVKGVKEHLQGKDVFLATLDPAKIGFGRIEPLVTPLDYEHHLNIWQTNSFPQKFGPVEGAENVKWHEPGHSELDDRPGVQALVRERIDAFIEGETELAKYKITPKIALEVAAHEGLVQEAYRDSVGIWTWSIGVTDYSGHKVRRYIDNPADIERCIEVYIWLLDTKYLPSVEKAFQGRELTEEQLAGALSFHWNTGSIQKASWVKSFLAGDTEEAKRKFMLWRKPPEIIGRRKKERDLFFDGRWTSDGTVTHYPLVGSNGKLNYTHAKKLDITEAVTEAIQAHYSEPLPVPIEPEKPPVQAPEGDIDTIRAYILERMPDIDKTALDLILASQILRELQQPLEIEGETIALPSPVIEQGDFIETKETEMTFDIFNWKSKTFWTGAVMVLAGLLNLVAPESALSGLIASFFGDTDAGLLLTNGLAIVFGREAISKISK